MEDSPCARVHHFLRIRKDRQQVLFTVLAAVSLSHDAAYHVAVSEFARINGERNGTSLACLDTQLLTLCFQHILCLSVKQRHRYCSICKFSRQVSHRSIYLRLVILTQEARHTRLYHQLLLCHRLVGEQSHAHCLIMCQSHKAPRGDALRQCELHSYITLGICHELRHEESCLVEVSAQTVVSISLIGIGSVICTYCLICTFVNNRYFC